MIYFYDELKYTSNSIDFGRICRYLFKNSLKMAATLKAVVLTHYKREDGTYNVKIRVTLNRKVGYINTEHYVDDKQLSKDKKVIKDTFVSDALSLEVINLRKEISRLGASVNHFSVKQLVEHLSNIRNPSKDSTIDFIAFSETVIQKMKQANRDSYRNYQAAINNLKRFIKSDKLNINEFTARFLRKYEEHLRALGTIGSRGLELNMASLRSLFNQARLEYNDEDTGLIKIAHYPFNSYKIPKAEASRKKSLNIETIAAIRDYEYVQPNKHTRDMENPRAVLARDVYMLSFMLVGINSIDLYHLEKISKDGRITYNRSKTKDRRQDNAEISIEVPPEAIPLIEKYKDPTKKRLFNFYQRYSTSQGFNLAVNKGLKVVGEAIGVTNLDYYSARHSWATIARNDCDISMDDIALALNHSTIGASRVTDIYVRKDWSRIDKANRKVLDLLSTKK